MSLFHIKTCSLSLSYKPRTDLCIYKSTEIKSSFIEILNSNKTNVIVGCIYRLPHMDLNEFNDYYIYNLLDKLSKENKTVFLLADFNIELLDYDQHSPTNEFLDFLSCHIHLPHIVQPTRMRNNLKNLTDNIYSNVIMPLYQTISPNFLLLLIFSLTRHLQN